MRVTRRIASDELKAVDKLAKREGVKRSEMVRKLITAGRKAYERDIANSALSLCRAALHHISGLPRGPDSNPTRNPPNCRTAYSICPLSLSTMMGGVGICQAE
jgi:hypothetical protein